VGVGFPEGTPGWIVPSPARDLEAKRRLYAPDPPDACHESERLEIRRARSPRSICSAAIREIDAQLANILILKEELRVAASVAGDLGNMRVSLGESTPKKHRNLLPPWQPGQSRNPAGAPTSTNMR
jgi:hypothetical protein